MSHQQKKTKLTLLRKNSCRWVDTYIINIQDTERTTKNAPMTKLKEHGSNKVNLIRA